MNSKFKWQINSFKNHSIFQNSWKSKYRYASLWHLAAPNFQTEPPNFNELAFSFTTNIRHWVSRSFLSEIQNIKIHLSFYVWSRLAIKIRATFWLSETKTIRKRCIEDGLLIESYQIIRLDCESEIVKCVFFSRWNKTQANFER